MDTPIENPYESPTVDTTMAIPEKKTSGLLMAVCIASIVLGSLGVLGGFVSLMQYGMNAVMNQRMTMPQGFDVPNEQVELQREMQQEMQQVVKRWMPIVIPLLLLSMLASIGLIAGAIGTLRLRPWGRRLLIVAFWGAIVLELGYMAPNISMQVENGRIVEQLMSRMMEAGPNSGKMPAGFGEGMAIGIKAWIIVVMVFVVVVNLIEVGFYSFGIIYLGRDNVRAHFAPPEDAILVQSG